MFLDGEMMPIISTTEEDLEEITWKDDEFGIHEVLNNFTEVSTTECIFGPKICGPANSTLNDLNHINSSETGNETIPKLIQKKSGSLTFSSSSKLLTLLMCFVYFSIVY